MTKQKQRIDDLNELAASEGITLPWPAEVIAQLEEQGHTVDLLTGMVNQNGADDRISLTAWGEAVAVALKAWHK